MDHEYIKNEIVTVLEKMGFQNEVDSLEVHEGVTNRFCIRLRGTAAFQDETARERSAASMLIGAGGANLAALEHVVKKIMKRRDPETSESRFTLDINDYRIRRLGDLKQDVKTATREARLYKKAVPLRPMSSFERRIVHLLLAEYPDITTESIGEEPGRRVVIKPCP